VKAAFLRDGKGKGKKLSLPLAMYDSMKTYSLLNEAPRREDVWGNGGIAARILTVGTR